MQIAACLRPSVGFPEFHHKVKHGCESLLGGSFLLSTRMAPLCHQKLCHNNCVAFLKHFVPVLMHLSLSPSAVFPCTPKPRITLSSPLRFSKQLEPGLPPPRDCGLCPCTLLRRQFHLQYVYGMYTVPLLAGSSFEILQMTYHTCHTLSTAFSTTGPVSSRTRL